MKKTPQEARAEFKERKKIKQDAKIFAEIEDITKKCQARCHMCKHFGERYEMSKYFICNAGAGEHSNLLPELQLSLTIKNSITAWGCKKFEQK